MKAVQTPITAPKTPDNVRTAFESAAEAVASLGQEDIFEVLVSGAVRALAVDLAFIGIIAEEGIDKVQSIAVCDRGRIEPNFEYALEGGAAGNARDRERDGVARDDEPFERYPGCALHGDIDAAVPLAAVVAAQVDEDLELAAGNFYVPLPITLEVAIGRHRGDGQHDGQTYE